MGNERMVPAQISGDNSAVAPPVPIPNTAVKRCSPDGSTAIGRARVGRRQNRAPAGQMICGCFFGVTYSSREWSELGSRDMDGKPKGRAIGKIASQHAVLGSRRVDGQARAVAGERVGTNESVGRRQNKMPGGLNSSGISLSGTPSRAENTPCWEAGG